MSGKRAAGRTQHAAVEEEHCTRRGFHRNSGRELIQRAHVAGLHGDAVGGGHDHRAAVLVVDVVEDEHLVHEQRRLILELHAVVLVEHTMLQVGEHET